jgi:hypothetical protein
VGIFISEFLDIRNNCFLAISVEHLLFVSSKLYGIHRRINAPECNLTGSDLFEMFMKEEHAHVFAIQPYSILLSLILEVSTRIECQF